MSTASTPSAEDLYRRAREACERGDVASGAGLIGEAIRIDAGHARFHALQGMALAHLGQSADALLSFDRAIALAPDTASTHGSRADALVALGRLDEALASFQRALALDPQSVADWCNYGAALIELGRHERAAVAFERALALAPGCSPAHANRGNAFAALGRHDEALASYAAALAIEPDNADVLNNRGNLLRRLGRCGEALADLDRALALAPGRADVLCNRALALHASGRLDEALTDLDRALQVDPQGAEALFIRSQLLSARGRHREAIAGFERAVELGHPGSAGPLALACRTVCDWPRAARAQALLGAQIAAGAAVVSPFVLLACGTPPAEQLATVRNFVRHELGAPTAPRELRPARVRDRIRVAYLSGNFNPHPVTYLVAGLFECHDRKRFEVIGVSAGPHDASELRARVAAGFDRFYDWRERSDEDVAAAIAALDVDILVDLSGLTEDARPAIAARRPAPIQVSYLGYLGTMAADHIDYILADRIALPFDQQPLFTEKIVHLPDCFLINDRKLAIAPSTPSRAEAGLPTVGFVFCSFNNSYKFTEPVFATWMRLLRDVAGSVLWLLESNAPARENLRQEAQRCRIDPARLVFASRVSFADHLARQRLADLFLDTTPYNAGATGCAALWSGVPLLTCVGDGIVGRMAASMLAAIGLPELATRSLADYEARARKLARDPALLASIRTRLERNRLTHPLFDTDRTCRAIEAAYARMHDIRRRGEPPQPFAVDSA